MNYAYCKLTNGSWDYVYVSDIISGKICESDVVEWLCPSCKKRAFIRHPAARVLHVACYHTDTCDFVNDGNDHKIHKKVVDQKIDLDSILDYADGPVRNTGGGGVTGGENPVDFPPDIETIESIDEIEEEVIASVNTLRGIISCYKRDGGEKECLNSYKIKDVMMTNKNFLKYKKYGINRPLIVFCRRVPLSKEMKEQLKVPTGYTCLMDAYSNDFDNAIYFFVRLSHKEQYSRFTELVGEKKDNGRGYKRQYIVVFGRWERCANNKFITYKAIINSHCCFFTNGVIKDEDDSE